MESIFMEKDQMPSDQDLIDALGSSFKTWMELKNYLNTILDKPSEEWNYPGKKYGWSFRMKSKKRNIIYFLPRKNYFKVALIFGAKATDKVMQSDVSEIIKTELRNARVYAEGRGIRIDITDSNKMNDIKTLIQIKLEN